MVTYLRHYGVIGMKWGVRRYQNKDGSLTEEGKRRYSIGSIDDNYDVVIEKGSRISSVSTSKKIALDQRGIYGYDDADTVDKHVYEGAYASYLSWYRSTNGKVYKHTFTNSEDLVLPSKKKKIDTFIDLLSKDKAFKDEFDAYMKSDFVKEREPILDEFAQKTGLTSLSDKQYQKFMLGFNQVDSLAYSSKKFVSTLSSMKYNAIIDDNNAGIYNGAHNPLYVFNGSKSLHGASKYGDISKGKRHSWSKMANSRDVVELRNGGRLIL